MKLVRVNSVYNSYLSKLDSKIQDNSLTKSNKPFIGCLFQIEQMEYFVPLSSAKPKHALMRESLTLHKVVDGGKVLAVLNICNMIPIVPELYKEIDIAAEQRDYARLLKKEYMFCKKNFAGIQAKSAKLYKAYINNTLISSQRAMCCDFPLLEKACVKFVESSKKKIVKKTAIIKKDRGMER